jgi:hypothetical protein
VIAAKDHWGRISFSKLVYAGAVVFLANALFFLLVFLVDASINHGKLSERVSEAIAEGRINSQDYPPDLATYSDRYTDCIGISLNLGGRTDRSAWGFIRDAEIPTSEGVGACTALIRMLADPKAASLLNYVRYWHGYQIFSKPFLYFTTVQNLRYVFACLVIFSLLLFSFNVANAFGGTRAQSLGIWFAGSFILLTDTADLGNVFTHSVSILTIFLAPVVAFWALRAGYKQHLLLIAVAVGCANSFFDLLFNPPLGLSALIIGVAAALSDEDLAIRDVVKLVALVALGWAIGFFGTYVCRFAIAAALSDIPAQTLNEIYTAGMFRVSGTEDKIQQRVFWATIKNYGYPMLRPTFAIFVLISGLLAFRFWRSCQRIELRPVLLLFLVPTFVSVSWYEILRNHSQHHHWFTYRSASFSLLCLAAFVIFGLSQKPNSSSSQVASVTC